MEKRPYDCIVWGLGEVYEKRLNQILFEIEKKNLNLVATVVRTEDRYCNQKDGFCIIGKEELAACEFDYLIINSDRYYNEIKSEAKAIGIPDKKIINGKVFELPLFDFGRYVKLIENPVTILSDDCWAGYVYHDLCLPFSSPVINTYFGREEYARFIQDPLFYLGTELEMVREGSFAKSQCPIGQLGEGDRTVKVQFLHSDSFAKAKVEWDRRKERINPRNIFVKNGFSSSERNPQYLLDTFRKIPYPKILFYYDEIDIEEAIRTEFFIKQYHKSGNVRFYNYNDMVREGYRKVIDVLKLLTGEMDYAREKY